MTETERQRFYAPIPPLMHHFPHIFVMQQRQEQQKRAQEAMMKQQQQQTESGGTSQAGAKGGTNDIDALKQTGILEILSNPEGRVKVQQLASRIQSGKEKAENARDWDEERKAEYLRNFSEHPVLVDLDNCNDDPLRKLQTFLEMSEADLAQMLTLQHVLTTGNAEEVIRKAFSEGGGEKMDMHGMAMINITNTMRTLSNMKLRANDTSSGHGHDHSHGHSHGHGEHCSHNHGMPSTAPNIASGAADKMDR